MTVGARYAAVTQVHRNHTVAALTAAGAVKVYREVASGAQTDRAQLRQVLARLAAGVTRLDRLARSTRDLLNTLAAITGTGSRVHIPW